MNDTKVCWVYRQAKLSYRRNGLEKTHPHTIFLEFANPSNLTCQYIHQNFRVKKGVSSKLPFLF